jgi:protein subunit release factor B
MAWKMSKTPIVSVTKADCVRQTFRCPGNGGQKVNKTESGVRYTHTPSGAVGHACDERSQHQNSRLAFERMARSPQMISWLRLEMARRLGQKPVETEEQLRWRVEKQIEEDFRNGNVLVEEVSLG